VLSNLTRSRCHYSQCQTTLCDIVSLIWSDSLIWNFKQFLTLSADPLPGLQWSRNAPERRSGSFSDDRNAVPVPFWENGSSKLGPARSAVVIRDARVTRLTLLKPIAIARPKISAPGTRVLTGYRFRIRGIHSEHYRAALVYRKCVTSPFT